MVKVGDLSWIGIGACVRQVLEIGSSVVVGAGAAVVCNISDNMTVAGVPARVLVRT
ncbi:putative lipopolysaccharide biosynthesis O-acetyl transferase WbbJ [compost metagenome]